MTETQEKFPARLHVIFASQSSNAIVFRRGPSKRVATFSWDRKTDKFKIGQWLKGRIYERRSDISSDGRHLIYFAMNGKWNSETKGSWTAISKPPYLKALDLYAKGDCWEGGGLFLSSNKYWLNEGRYNKNSLLSKNSNLTGQTRNGPKNNFGSECTGVYYPRLLRDGWSLMERKQTGKKYHSFTVFEKKLPNHWVLRKIAHEQCNSPVGKGCYWDEHELFNTKSNLSFNYPDWEWADFDNKSLVWATAGKLFRAGFLGQDGLKEAKLLHDFNDYVFEPIRAPY